MVYYLVLFVQRRSYSEKVKIQYEIWKGRSDLSVTYIMTTSYLMYCIFSHKNGWKKITLPSLLRIIS